MGDGTTNLPYLPTFRTVRLLTSFVSDSDHYLGDPLDGMT